MKMKQRLQKHLVTCCRENESMILKEKLELNLALGKCCQQTQQLKSNANKLVKSVYIWTLSYVVGLIIVMVGDQSTHELVYHVTGPPAPPTTLLLQRH